MTMLERVAQVTNDCLPNVPRWTDLDELEKRGGRYLVRKVIEKLSDECDDIHVSLWLNAILSEKESQCAS